MVNYRTICRSQLWLSGQKKNFLWQELKRLRRKQLQGSKKKNRSMEDSRGETVLKSDGWMDGSQVSPE